MRNYLVATLVAATSWACGSDPSTADSIIAADAVDDAEVSLDAVSDGDGAETPVELCQRVWGRLVACGHFYTFPTFEAACSSFDSAEVETLRSCSRRVCADLYLCLRDELHIPEGGN